jgi:protein SCO1
MNFALAVLTVVRRIALSCLLGLVTLAPVRAEPPQERALSENPNFAVIGHAPDFTLLDTSGQAVRLTDYRGRVTLLAFIFTTCPSVCPIISQQMSKLQDALRDAALFPGKATMLSVTVDPETDTAGVLANYAKTFHADPAGWRFLRDSAERTKPVLAAYDEWTKRLPQGETDHPARVYLIDKKGDIREIYSLSFFDERQAFLDIQALTRE